jgi:hypothetical protein
MTTLKLSRVALLGACGMLMFMIAGCSEEKFVPVGPLREVEIKPDEWLAIETKAGRVWMRFAWGERVVTWDGKGHDLGELELPICLRQHEDDLYMVTFDREDLSAIKLRYYCLKSGVRSFKEIQVSDFPRSIATQNMWLQPHSRILTGLNGRIDMWELIRKLDVDSIYFAKTLTGQMWVSLETGKNISEAQQLDSESIVVICRGYKGKHNPVPLPSLVREK